MLLRSESKFAVSEFLYRNILHVWSLRASFLAQATRLRTDFRCPCSGRVSRGIFKARNIRGSRLPGMSNPYFVVKYGNEGKKVSLESKSNSGGGPNPVWNYEFEFPLPNGGEMDHNSLEIDIYNRHEHTGCFRRDNRLGFLRVRGLAEWILKHDNNITQPQWYPVFYTKKSCRTVEKGEILMKFFFQKVKSRVFAEGQYQHPACRRIPGVSGNGYSHVKEKIDLSSIFGAFSAVAGVIQVGALFV
ncbi:hypothetical protein R1flu_001832 [Riccia fluitans]|uniref:C2 domain-containing protein n=1 Tax=Riccia fluitans TaxID=41844 RepID=A0ABD1Y4G3_9MARC